MYAVCVDVARTVVPVGVRDAEDDAFQREAEAVASGMRRALTGKK